MSRNDRILAMRFKPVLHGRPILPIIELASFLLAVD